MFAGINFLAVLVAAGLYAINNGYHLLSFLIMGVILVVWR